MNPETPTPSTCDCTTEPCPLGGKCSTDNVIYEAKLETDATTKTYIGLASTSFKARYRNHKTSFTHPSYKNSTALSKKIWDLKANRTPFRLTWSIKKRAQPYNPLTKRCNLCLWEKYFILKADSSCLNSKKEIVSPCLHRDKFLLAKYG